MHCIFRYLRTMRQYAASAKGQHDILDYLCAGVSFLLVSAFVLMLLSIVR